MQSIDMPYLCTVIGNLSGIPVRWYEGETQRFAYALAPLPVDPMRLYQEEIWQVPGHVGYYVAPHFHYYGVVRCDRWRFVIGPTRQVEDTAQELRELAFRADVPPDQMEAFVNSMKGIVRMPLNSVMQMLCTINYILNDEKLELKGITIYEAQQEALNHQLEQHREDAPAPPSCQAIYKVEQSMLHFVTQGDTRGLKDWLNAAPAAQGGTLAYNQLRQAQNTFIVSCTLVCRAAIHGGMEVEEAFPLSDAFIQKCELLDRLDLIANLQYHMVVEFTRRVEQIRLGQHPSRLTIEVANYIRRHLSEPITAEQIAAELFISRPHLSRKFRQETGETLTNFILKEKVAESKQLLRYSEKSIAAIAAYLGFSSLPHFARVFKKYTGQTPQQYRDRL